MITQSDAALAAWRATERTLDAKVVITDSNGKSTEYGTADITSIGYDSGAWTGDTFSIGSTYENNITVAFAHLVEGLKQGFKVTAKIGIKLPDGTYEYASLGIFIISDEITMDRNNDATTIKAYDQMCVMQGNYTSKLTYPAKVIDVIAEIANMAGVELNTDDIARLSVLQDLQSAITGQSYCTAIGWIAQFYGGFATFDRDGKLTIRQVTDASYTLDPGQYLQAGLTKNEATYQIGGIQCQVTTTTKDSTGESSENTTTLQAGSTAGSQIQITNNLMTQDRLDAIWSAIKDITFYPYSLTWFGNPVVEAGDWLTVQDTKGNKFNVPNNSYTMTFDGSLSATSKADQTSTSSSSYSYSGTLSQVVKQLAGRQGATGNYIYGTDTTVAPANAKIGDLWYKQNGNKVEMWLYEKQSNGTGKWVKKVDDLTGAEISEKVNTAMSDADIAKQNANTAVETGNSALAKAQTGIDTANAAADKASNASVDASKAINDSASAIAQAQSAASAASNSVNIATAVKQSITELRGGSTATIAELEDGLALKLTKDDLDGYATEDWTSNQITTTASGLQEQITSVKKAAATATTNVTTLTTDVNGLKTSVSTVTNTANQSKVDISTLQQQATGFQTSISSLQQTKADQSWTTNQINASSNSLKITIADIQGQVNDSAVGNNLIPNSSASQGGVWGYKSTSTTNGNYKNGSFPIWVIHNSSKTAEVVSQGKRFVIEPNTQYTLSFTGLMAGNVTNMDVWVLESKTITDINDTSSKFDVTQEPMKEIRLTPGTAQVYSATFTTPADIKTAYVRFDNNASTNGSDAILLFTDVKLEKGSHATPWCPNPNEVATATSVTSLSATVDSLSSTVSKKVDTTTFTSYQTQTATAIADKVSSGAFNSYKTQTDSAIQSKVSSADYNTKVTQLSNMINSKVSQSDWTNSAVGENLVPNSNADTSGFPYGYNSLIGKHSFYNGGKSYLSIIHNTSSTAEKTSGGQRFFITAGQTYTLSFKAFNNGLLSSADVWLLGRPNSNTTDDYTVAQQLVTSVKFSTSGIQYYKTTFTVKLGIENAYLRFDNNGTTANGSSADLYFNEVKIEKGEIATPWCPAASEIANYSQIQQLSDNINLRVQKNDVINQINVSSESILIAGNKVHITGQTTIDNAVIKSAMIDSLSADKITAGKIDANLVNVTNLNANNITSGTLSGTNLSVNLGTGEILFQRGSVKSTNGNLDLEIDDGTLAVVDYAGNGAFFENGKIYMSDQGGLAKIMSGDYTSKQYGVIEQGTGYMGITDGGIAIHGTNNGFALMQDTSNTTTAKVVEDSAYWGYIYDGCGLAISGQKAYLGGDTNSKVVINGGTAIGGSGTWRVMQPHIIVGQSSGQVHDGGSANGNQIQMFAQNINLNEAWINNVADTWYSGLTDWWFRQNNGSTATIHVQSVSQSSLLSLKTNLNKLDGSTALSALVNTDVYNYNYKSDLKNGITKTYATPIIDDINARPKYNMPYDFISADGVGRDDGTILGYAVAAIQELNSKITSLETEVKQLKGAA